MYKTKRIGEPDKKKILDRKFIVEITIFLPGLVVYRKCPQRESR